MGILKSLVERAPDYSEEYGDQPLVAPGTRTAIGELPEDGGTHVVGRALDAVGSKLPDHSEQYGDQPLVAPGTRSAIGELASTPEAPAASSEASDTLGHVAVEAVETLQLPPSAEVVAYEERVAAGK